MEKTDLVRFLENMYDIVKNLPQNKYSNFLRACLKLHPHSHKGLTLAGLLTIMWTITAQINA